MSCFLCEASSELSCSGCQVKYCSDQHLNSHLQELEDGQSLCLPYKVVNQTGLGRHFVATRDIKPLELILKEPAAVIGPATKTKPVCLNCLRPAATELR